MDFNGMMFVKIIFHHHDVWCHPPNTWIASGVYIYMPILQQMHTFISVRKSKCTFAIPPLFSWALRLLRLHASTWSSWRRQRLGQTLVHHYRCESSVVSVCVMRKMGFIVSSRNINWSPQWRFMMLKWHLGEIIGNSHTSNWVVGCSTCWTLISYIDSLLESEPSRSCSMSWRSFGAGTGLWTHPMFFSKWLIVVK